MSEAVAQRRGGAIRSLVPARMDRLPWTKFHWSVVLGLGVSWILDGLEIQIVSESGFQKSLGMSAAQVGLTGTVYLVGSGIAGFAPNMIFLWVFRFIAGLGIGGEYTAINSAIDELIPAHYRGRVDIAVNGTYWGGAMIGATANLWLLDPNVIAVDWGWRIGFFIGPVLGLIIIVAPTNVRLG